jgi:hypothetical protein
LNIRKILRLLDEYYVSILKKKFDVNSIDVNQIGKIIMITMVVMIMIMMMMLIMLIMMLEVMIIMLVFLRVKMMIMMIRMRMIFYKIESLYNMYMHNIVLVTTLFKLLNIV